MKMDKIYCVFYGSQNASVTDFDMVQHGTTWYNMVQHGDELALRPWTMHKKLVSFSYTMHSSSILNSGSVSAPRCYDLC